MLRIREQKQKILTVVAASAVLLLFVVAVYRSLKLPDEEELSPPSTQMERPSHLNTVGAAIPHLTVAEMNGSAERRAVGSSMWTPVHSGDKLAADESLRTAKDATVRLEVDENSRIELAGRSELGVKELTETVHQIDLVLGKIDIDYDESENRLLKITASDDGDAVAETNRAKFVVQNVDGELTVAAKMGKVKLTARAETVVVEPETFSRVSKGNAPMKPEPIPLDVLLKVANPTRITNREKATVISGKTNVGAMLEVNDVPAEVDESGRFRVTVPLSLGQNEVDVVSTTAWGSAKKRLPIINVSTSAEITDAKVKWGPAQKGKKKKGSP
jgi:hypothetical protein